MERGTQVGRRAFLAAAGGTATALSCAGSSRAAIDPELVDRSGRVTGVVRLADGQVDGVRAHSSRERVVAGLRAHATSTQQRVVDYVAETPGTEIRRQFWLANAVLVTVDTDRASFADLAAIDGVDRIHRTDTGTGKRPGDVDETEPARTATTQDREVSYGLEMMHVPEVWERFDTRGEGSRIAIIDSGVDPSHPDIDLAEWAEFDAEGQRVDSDPHDPNGHGTGMSSLATGGDASGTQIGVAPGADLLVAKHSSEDFFTSALAGLEWAVENGADAASLSLDIGPLEHEAIEAVRNAVAAGTVVVSPGYGPERFLSPGAMYSVLTAGAVDRELTPYRGGNGGEIRTERYWRSDVTPEDWPDRYVLPDVTTAGVDVLAAAPDNDEFDGGHVREDGYSNGPPHVSGVVALLRSLDGSLSPGEIERILTETAEQPGEPHEHPDPNGDFGNGIVNAAAAAAEVGGRDREVAGTVTDPEGNPVAGATVTAVTGDTAETDGQGRYTLSVPDGEESITASAVGYESVSRRVAPGEGRELAFETERRPDIQRGDRLPTEVQPGGTITLPFDFEHAEFTTVFVGESDHLVDSSAVTVRINGDRIDAGEPTEIGEATTLQVELDIGEGARGLLPLRVGLADDEATTQIELDPIHVHERPMEVTEDQAIQAAVDIASRGTTVALAGDRWEIPIEPREPPLPDSWYGNPVFEQTRDDRAGLVIDRPVRLTAADGHDPTLVASQGGDERSFGIQIATHFATLQGIEVVADGATGAVSALGSDGVRLRNLNLSGAENGVYAQFTKSLVVRDSSISASGTGVALRDLSVNALVRDNAIRGAQRGVFLSGRLGEELFDVDATVTGNAFENVSEEIDGEGTATVRNESGGQRQIGGEPPGDSRLDLLLYGATAAAVGILFYPYGRRRLG